MPSIITDILGLLGFLVSALGFLVVGFGLARFILDAYHKGSWQVQIALALGFFGLLIGIADFSTPGSVGAFALGAGVAFVMASMPNKTEDDSK
ncbi:MAG TPA: hypothetical protein VMT73_12540 [Anaerolineales bacterium]|nr:hypothetical protein [Anaerolineales bacterium]